MRDREGIQVLRLGLVLDLGMAALEQHEVEAQVMDEGNVRAEMHVAACPAQPPVITLTPPSTASHCPVMCLPASEANSSVTPFRSSSSPRRCNGACAASCSFPSRCSVNSVILLGKKPGQMALTVMLYLPHSQPKARVKLITAPLDVLYARVCISGGLPP